MLLPISEQTVLFFPVAEGRTPSGHRYLIHEGMLLTGWGSFDLHLILDPAELFVPHGDFHAEGYPAWLTNGLPAGAERLKQPGSAPYAMAVKRCEVTLTHEADYQWREGVSSLAGKFDTNFGIIDVHVIRGLTTGNTLTDDKSMSVMFHAGGSGYTTKAQRR